MAAVSTNYGTAGDSNLESNATASLSRGTKGSSKSDSGSGSHSASRSRSLSRVWRKRAGTVSSSEKSGALPQSASREQLCRDVVHGDWDTERCREECRHKKKQAARHVADIQASPVRVPVRRSMFGFGEPGKQSFGKVSKGKDGIRSLRSGPSHQHQHADTIELMPQVHRQHARQDGDGFFEGGDSDKMVIRKEVQYSIQYEVPGHGQGPSKRGSNDAIAYV